MMDADIEIYSSSWKKPTDVLQSFRKRRKALQNRIQNSNVTKNNTNLKNVRNNSSTANPFNPFRKNACNEKPRINSDLELSSDTTIFQLLHPQNFNNKTVSQTETIITILNKEGEKTSKKIELKGENELPIDWSLKTHLRFQSSSPFAWNAMALKTTEEASGTTGFVRCLHSHQGELDTSASAQLHQHCLVWLHPSLPWVNPFPQHNEHVAGNGIISSNPKIQEALFKDWGNSVRSLFQLLRSRQCPYFYVCASSFTVLFRASGIAGISEINAMMTPTTKGLRQSLKNEGIEYSMPLFKEQTYSPEKPENIIFQKSETNLNDSTVEENDDEVDAWMSNAGLQNPQFLSSIQKKKSLEDKPIDNRPESLVYVEGAEVQALYNFLINARNLCVATSGSNIGIPATLLAPVAFQGGTLKSCSVKQKKIHKDHETFHCLDLHGPILPHVTHMLVELSQTLLSSSYSIKFNTLQSTVPFSTSINSPFVPSAFAKQSLTDCGLHPKVLDLFCSTKKSDTMNEIFFKNGAFVWR